MRAHGFQGPNWNNLNDFVIVEVELKNTGVLDMNMDGVAEQLTHDIQALTFQMNGEAYMSVSSYAGGGRNVNDIVPTVIARQFCWIDDVDENGEPWAFAFYRTAPTTGSFTAPPAAGNWDHGFNGGSTKNYTDIYTGWVMLDAKIGGLPTDANRSTSTLPIEVHDVRDASDRRGHAAWLVRVRSNHTVRSDHRQPDADVLCVPRRLVCGWWQGTQHHQLRSL